MAHNNNLIGSGGVAITPSDTTNVNLIGLYVGGAGNVTVIGADGNSVLFNTVPAGAQIAMGITKVMATGTTATLMTGFVR